MNLSEWSDDKKEMNMNVNENLITDNDGTEWIENDLGFYAVDGTTLFFLAARKELDVAAQTLFGYDMEEINTDYFVEVSDLTELTTEEYSELATLLFDTFGYELGTRFL